MARKWLRDGVLIAALLAGVVPGGFQTDVWAREPRQGQVGGTIAVAQLPPEAVGTLNLIAAGGPYPYEKDGVVFGNRERLLPPHRRGYYHEYTVPTPHARNRGARRIVCGGPLARTDNCYYSDDHYTSFNRIVE
jgi:ribonuclease T1